MKADHAFLGGPHPRAFVHRGWHSGEFSGMENSLTAFRHVDRVVMRSADDRPVPVQVDGDFVGLHETADSEVKVTA